MKGEEYKINELRGVRGKALMSEGKMLRYQRNHNMLTESDQDVLKKTNVCIIGCGGLGGYVIEMLARIGVGSLTVVDGDRFDETNLNRQLLSSENNLGMFKAVAAKERILTINSETNVRSETVFFTKENADDIVEGHDLIIDALDKIPTRLLLQEACKKHGIPLVHGAIGGWYGQVAVILPGDDTLLKLYANNTGSGVEKLLGNPSFTPATIASIQVSEAIKLILGKGELLRHKILYLDLLNLNYDIVMFE